MAKQIKDSLKRAVEQLPRPDVKVLWEQPVVPMKQHDYITQQNIISGGKTRQRKLMNFATGFACLFLFLSGGTLWYGQNLAVYNVIGLDINPSVEITINKKHKIMKLDAMNVEAEQILDGRNYKGWDIADAVETLTVSIKQKGYFQAERNAVLLTVNGTKTSDAKALADELSGTIMLSIDQADTPTTVVSQTMPLKHNFKEEAKANQVSSGKVKLATELSALLPQFTTKQLLELPLETLVEAMELLEEDIPGDITIHPSRYEILPTLVAPSVGETEASLPETAPTEEAVLPPPPETTSPPKVEKPTTSPTVPSTIPSAAPSPPPTASQQRDDDDGYDDSADDNYDSIDDDDHDDDGGDDDGNDDDGNDDDGSDDDGSDDDSE